jgi:MFS family permease
MTETSGRYDRRNFTLNGIEGGLFVAGSSLMSAQTVLPALITRLGGNNIAVGALSVIIYVGLLLPQIFAARYTQTLPWKKPWAVRFGTAQRVVVLCIAIVTFLLGATHATLALLFFFILFTLNQIFMGIATPGWFDMYAKLTPLRLRGRLTGVRNSVAGVGSLFGGAILTWLLAEFTFPSNYSFAIGGAFIVQFISIIIQSRLVEELPSNTLPQSSMREYFHQLRVILRSNTGFRTFLSSMIFLIPATMPLGFFTVYALKHFSAGEELIGEFTLIIVAGQVIGGMGIGYLADHTGNKRALISASVAMFVANLVAVFAPTLALFKIVFFFVGINLGSDLMTRYNLAIEFGPPEQRSTYIGLMNTVLAPLYLTGFLGGWISDLFGYPMLFIISGFFSIAGILFLILRVKEPRGESAHSIENERISAGIQKKQ